MRVQVTLFGPLRVVGPLGGLDAAGFPSRKARHVFELLALAGGDSVAKERLVDEIWGERLPADPAGAVEQAVSVLRRCLRSVCDEPLVRTRGGRYLLDPSVVTVDVGAFDDAVARASREPVLDRREPHLRAAVALAVAPLLTEEGDVAWADRERERRRLLIERSWRDLARLAAARGDHEAALHAAEAARHSAVDAADEVREMEIEALAALGRGDDAHRELARFERDVADERRPARIDVDALRSRIAPVAARVVVRTELAPMGTLPFVGRADVLAAVDAAAGEPASALLLVGAAGTGRSRLLREIAARSDRGTTVVEVACAPPERGVPLLVAARIVRGLARAAGARVPAPDDRPAALFARVAPWIDRCAPVRLVVDDLHRADEGTLAFLAALVDARAGVQLVGSCRVALAAPVADALGGPPVRMIGIGPLTDRELAAAIGAGPAVDAVLAETAGHPATLAACIAAAGRDGVLDPHEVEAVEARVHELPHVARAAVHAAAVLRSPTVGAVTRRVQRRRDDVAAALALAAERGVVRVDGDRVDVIPAILRRSLAARING